MDKVKKFNIYQKRNVRKPWCLIIELKKNKKRIRADCEIVADWIPNTTKLFKLSDIPLSTNKKLLEYLETILKSYKHPLTEDDILQINEELDQQKESMLNKKRKVKKND